MGITGKLTITRIKSGRIEETEDTLAMEREISLDLHGRRILCSTCSPADFRELVYGFLRSEGFIEAKDHVTSLRSAGNEFLVELSEETRPPVDRLPARVESGFTIPITVLLAAARECRDRGIIFRETGGTHTAAIGADSGLITLFEDVSRAHALEKAVGDALLRGLNLDDKFIFLSSRLSKVMVEKIARCGIPIVGAVSAPTKQAVESAEKLGICVCGFIRDERVNVYSQQWRVRIG